jgi:multidrug resistance protein, MATE family
MPRPLPPTGRLFALLFNRKNEVEFKLRSAWRLDIPLVRQFLKFGLPSGLQWALEGLAFTVFLIIMGRLTNGDAALASSSIAVTVMMLSVLPSMGVAQAIMTLVGQSMGEKKPEKAEQVTWDGVKISSIYMGCVSLTFIFFPEFYLSWFQNNDNAALWEEVMQVAPRLLTIVGIFTLFDSMYLNISFALKGAGDTRFVSLMALTVPWPLMVVPAFLVRDFAHAETWAWSFTAVYSFVITAILVQRFRTGKWKSMSVIGGK